MTSTNPLVNDLDVAFLLCDVHDTKRLPSFPAFAEHSMESFELFIGASRRLAREVLYPAYRAMDQEPPRFVPPEVFLHPAMHGLYAHLVEHGCIVASRPPEVSGLSVPLTVTALSNLYLMAANAAAYAFAGLTTGAAHLIEAFGTAALKEAFMEPMYAGRWTGTMALTEPHAGSSLSDVTTRATPQGDGGYRVQGTKVFISGGEQDLTENIVHLTLARIDGAPAGIKGVSLFAIPKKRIEGGALVDNDVRCSGVFHKLGWKGIPSVALSFGDAGDCHGYLVGEPHKGISYMFQMMNEARIMVGMNGVATASVAYHESLEYARTRPQGRALDSRDPKKPQVPIVEHADVRRMLLRQKAIVEGAMSLVVQTAYFADLAAHAPTAEERQRAALLLDLLTPVAKSFPAERGFEANALAVQLHGGYGYTSEYLPEAWLRDQKLNSIHEGTTGIQSLDLLGRKVVAGQGAALRALGEEVRAGAARAKAAGVDPARAEAVVAALVTLEELSLHLAGLGLSGEVESMLAHAADYLDAMGVLLVAWQWLLALAALGETGRSDAFARGKQRAAEYWLATELPRIDHLAALCRTVEGSYLGVKSDEL
jgi:alkylation response protein AidB-like acyl-CoA dehydrogenase